MKAALAGMFGTNNKSLSQQVKVTDLRTSPPVLSANELLVKDYRIPFDQKKLRFCHKRFKKNAKGPRAHGGITIAYMTYTVDNYDLVLIQIACCSTRDLYNKKIGREIAAGRFKKYGAALVIDTRSSEGFSSIMAAMGPDRLSKFKDHIAHAKILDEYMAQYAGQMRDFLSCSNGDKKLPERRAQVLLHPKQLRMMEHFDPYYTADE